MEYLVTSNGFKPNGRNIEAIKEFPVPITLTELLGIDITLLLIYKGFAKIAQPLYALTEKDVEYHWTTKCGQLNVNVPLTT